MNAGDVVGLVSLFLAGILAGEEFVIRFGVRAPVASLEEGLSIQMRQALIRPLRVLVPAIFFPTLLSAAAVTLLDGFGPGFGFRWAAVIALLVWLVVTLAGTVPINSAVMDWQPNAPPANWRSTMSRWERLDTVRTWAALVAFGLLLAAIGAQLADI